MNSLFTAEIEKWYTCNQRDLPWRKTKDPYLIWVSEVILQQTRVAQGISYFYRFIDAFPTVRHLAEADEDEVLRLWQGLGYYSRARNMHKAAQQIMQLGGTFPCDYPQLRKLSGIGEYTCAAILSFAYDLPFAVLDGNVFRVLARVFGIDTPIDTTGGRKLFQALANEMLDIENPALYNQSIMDFGALQCTPKSPDCSSCPLADQCLAFRQSRVESLPMKVHKTAVRERHLIYINVHDDHSLLLHRRGESDIWEGLYEFPLIEVARKMSLDELVQYEWIKKLQEEGGVLMLKAEHVKHQLTHQTLWVDYYDMMLPHLNSSLLAPSSYQLIPRADLDRYALPRIILQLLEK